MKKRKNKLHLRFDTQGHILKTVCGRMYTSISCCTVDAKWLTEYHATIAASKFCLTCVTIAKAELPVYET